MKYYHSSDPIENFKLRLKIREVGRVNSLNIHNSSNDEKSRPLYEAIEILSWQEKKYSPSELSKYLAFKQSGHLPMNQRQREIYHSLTELEKETNKPLDQLLQNVMFYTYIDKDNKYFDKPSKIINPKGLESKTISYLGEALSHSSDLSSSNKKDNRLLHMKRRLKRNGFSFKEMHICLGTDINVEVLKSGHSQFPEHHVNEHILCSIYLYEDGLIEVSPSLSEITNEPDEDISTSDEKAVPNLFLSNKTIINAVGKGFRLNTFKFRSNDGSEYEYTLENINEVLIPKQIDEIRSKELLDDIIDIENNSGENNDDVDDDGYKNDWKQDPPPENYDISLSLYAEIVSAWGFEYDNIYISYEVILPDGWSVRSGNLGDGVAEKDFSDKFGKLAKEILLNDGYADGDDAVGMLHGSASIAKSDYVSFGLFLPNLRSKWKGINVSKSFGTASGYIIGITFYIITIISVILGEDYPFWIVPGLVIFIGLYTGVPSAPVIQAGIIDKTTMKKDHFIGNSTQSSKIKRKLEGSYLKQPKAHINHLINLSFDVKLNNEESIKPNQQPYILFEVHSVGMFNRHRLEGYGYTVLPTQSGNQCVEIQTWKPVVGDLSKMNEFYLGGSTRLRDISFAQIPSNDSFSINKFGVQTVSSGVISFRYNSILVNPKKSLKYLVSNNLIDKSKLKLDNKNSITTEKIQLRRTVEDLLSTYKNSMNSDSVLFGSTMNKSLTNPSPSASLDNPLNNLVSLSNENTPIKKKNAILDALNSNEKASKIASILALAKAKANKKTQKVSTNDENVNENDRLIVNSSEESELLIQSDNINNSNESSLPKELVISSNILNRNVSQSRYSNVDEDKLNDSIANETDTLLSK